MGDFPEWAVLWYGPYQKVFKYKGLPEIRYKRPRKTGCAGEAWPKT